MADTDQDWERWGAQDPYFGVYSEDRFRSGVMSEQDRADFFDSGEAHMEGVFRALAQAFPDAPAPRTAVDFGCGVGRLAIPLARRVEQTWGVDVSASMLAEAERNCSRAGCERLILVASDPALSKIPQRVDLVHSHIVFQHIPWNRGRVLLSTLADKVSVGGLLWVQLVTAHRSGRLPRLLARARYRSRALHRLWNLLRGRPLSDPPMQMHTYDLPALLVDLQDLGFSARHRQELWRDVESTTLIARRERLP